MSLRNQLYVSNHPDFPVLSLCCTVFLKNISWEKISACPVCYLPVEQAVMRMPRTPAISPVLQNLTYIHDENPVRVEEHGGSDFGGYPSLQERTDSFNITESMRLHCG